MHVKWWEMQRMPGSLARHRRPNRVGLEGRESGSAYGTCSISAGGLCLGELVPSRMKQATPVPQQKHDSNDEDGISLVFQSQFDTAELERVKQWPLRPQLAEPISLDELEGLLASSRMGRLGIDLESYQRWSRLDARGMSSLPYYWTWFMQYGERRRFPSSGPTLCWYPFPRKETLVAVTTGEETAY